MISRFALLLLLALPTAGFTWGDTGHQTVCEIAFQELDDVARSEVLRLVDRDAQYRSFAEACVWADGPPRQREFDHFMNFPRDTRAVTTDRCAMADTCLFTAIETDAAVLANPERSDADRLVALKLLGHWLGDIHQPMHVSFGDDRGANSVVAVAEEGGELVEMNLHAIWDSWIIARRLGDDYRALADRLKLRVTDADRDLWRYDYPAEWADESFQIAISPAVRYCFRQQGACWYDEQNLILNEGEGQRRLSIGDDYAALHLATVEQRLTQAGIRLGALLNRLLGPSR